MKAGIKKEYIIMAVVIVLLVVYLLFQNKDKLHYKVPVLEQVNKEAIEKVEIKSANQTIILVKKDGKWLIDPKGYPTDAEKVDRILDTLSKLTLTDLVAKTENYILYDLTEDKAIHVNAYTKEGMVRDFDIGKMAITYGHTFVKIKDNPNVYYARESFRSNFEVKPDELRDKTVMKLDSNEISEITIEKEGASYAFAKNVVTPPVEIKPEDNKKDDQGKPAPIDAPQKPEEQISWASPEGKAGKKAQIDSLITQLTNLTCQEFIEDKTLEDFKSLAPIYTLKLKGSKDYMISFFPKSEKKESDSGPGGEMYPAISSESPYPFLVTSWKADQIMKNPGDLLEEEKKVEEKK